jgi:hypothetical protein
MSDQPDPTLDDCECCQVEPPEQPIFNPPGQPALQYRIDIQPTFLQRMVDALPHETVPPNSLDPSAPRPLASLTARAPDDPSIALLDAWATVADVLTFYQERIANEGYLRTATDRESLLELAREIGYELAPGVAAGVDLAFTVEDAVGAPDVVTIPIGTKVQSIPGPGQLPQTFETIEAITARPEWNAFPPRQTDPEQVLQGMTDLFLDGTATQLQVGDTILFVGGDRVDDPSSTNWDLRILTKVDVDQPNKRTRVAWLGGLAVNATLSNSAGSTTIRVFAMRKRTQLFGHNAMQFRLLSSETKSSFLAGFGVDLDGSDLTVDSFDDWGNIDPDDPTVGSIVQSAGSLFLLDGVSKEFRTKGQINFDFDISDPKLLTGGWVALAAPPGGKLETPANAPQSDFPPPRLAPGPFPLSIGEDAISDPSLDVFEPTTDPSGAAVFQIVDGPNVRTRTDFALSATVTSVVTDRPTTVPPIDRRGAQFLVESDELTLGQRPVEKPVDGQESIPEVQVPSTEVNFTEGQTGNFIAVGLSVLGLTPGQKIALVGKRPNVKVVDPNTLAKRARDYVMATDPSDLGHIAPVVAGLQGLLSPPAGTSDPSVAGGLILDTPVGAREPLSGHTFELLDPLTSAPQPLTGNGNKISIPLKVWTLRSPTGTTGTATLPFFAVDTVPADPSGETIAEIRQIVAVFQGTGRMLLELDAPLNFVYDRGTLTLSANVADATNGETVANEALGNGNPAVANQTFELKKPPLTFTSSPQAPSGAQSTLTVQVNGVAWSEVPALFGSAPDDQVYVLRRTNDGQSEIIFGDGITGSRLPTGTSNIVANYRTGIGLAGQVAAQTISLLANRPLGVRSVINPLAAAGAADPATIDDARQNAPLTVRTIDRVVSVGDVEDFAHTFAGIGKAQSRLLWNGTSQVVQLTVGGADGQPIDSHSDLLRNLTSSLLANADPSLVLRMPIDSFVVHNFSLTLALDIDPRFITANVQAAIQALLVQSFSFAERDFGQPVSEAEIVALVQTVPGVIASNVVALTDETTQVTSNELTANVAQFDQDGTFVQATLLLIDPAKIDLSQVLTT